MLKAWAKPKRRHLAQNFLRLVERMNNLTLWMATAILSQRDVNDRAKRIMLFAQIAHVRLFSACVCACVHVCMSVCSCVCVCLCMCLHVYVCGTYSTSAFRKSCTAISELNVYL